MRMAQLSNKVDEFRGFLLKRNPSIKFAEKYINYLNSGIVKNYTYKIAKMDEIFSVDNISDLNKIYCKVKTDPNNIRLHNIYSGVISAYIKFLTGKELRKRVLVK